jgi:carbamoyltransferase
MPGAALRGAILLALKRFYVGLAATFHDSALAIVDPAGEVRFAEATERYLQNKRAYNCPPDDLVRMPRLVREHVDADAAIVAAVSWSTPYLDRLEALCRLPPPALGSPADDELSWPVPAPAALTRGLRNSVSQAALNLGSSRQIAGPVEVRRFDHHLSHAAAAAYTSPFDECAVAVVDGFGETAASAFYTYREGRIDRLDAPEPGPPAASLGHFYSRLCALCGFDPVQGEEWKVMGLACYGRSDERLYGLLRPLLRVEGLTLRPGGPEAETLRRLRELRRHARPPDAPPMAAADLAATGQRVFEEVMTELLGTLRRRSGTDRLALAGGCALNSTYNGKLLGQTGFRALHVHSAPADDGAALGAALLAVFADHPDAAPGAGLATPYLGSTIDPRAVERMASMGGLERLGCLTRAPGEIHRRAADLLGRGRIVGWIQGRAELGPRALGNRSILADPRRPEMPGRINAEVKFREAFRPFAPSILDEHGAAWFEGYQTSRYMERTLRFRPEAAARVPAVVHADGTGRLQSVRREWNPSFHRLLDAFFELTGVPLVLNTSLNVMGRPIAHSLEDALGLLFSTGLDALVVGDVLIET